MCFSLQLEALFEWLWGLNAKLERLTDTDQKVLITGNQIRLQARRGSVKNRSASLPEDSGDDSPAPPETKDSDDDSQAPLRHLDTETNRYSEGLKRRRHWARCYQLAEEQQKRVTSHRRNMNSHFADFEFEHTSDSDSDDGNMYNGNEPETNANKDEKKFGKAKYLASLSAISDGDSTDSCCTESGNGEGWHCNGICTPVKDAPDKKKPYYIWEQNEEGVIKRRVVGNFENLQDPGSDDENNYVELDFDHTF